MQQNLIAWGTHRPPTKWNAQNPFCFISLTTSTEQKLAVCYGVKVQNLLHTRFYSGGDVDGEKSEQTILDPSAVR